MIIIIFMIQISNATVDVEVQEFTAFGTKHKTTTCDCTLGFLSNILKPISPRLYQTKQILKTKN